MPGESLVPGVVPILRQLGVESRVQEFSRVKPGAGFVLEPDCRLEFPFGDVPGSPEDYAYNVRRQRFDGVLREAAATAGTEYFEAEAGIEVKGDELSLSPETLERSGGFFNKQPDCIVDATGRRRLVASQLDLPSREGPRSDTALFTHFDRLRETESGTVWTDVLDYGWSWRIPLSDRASFGIVMDTKKLQQYGDNPENQLESLRSNHEWIRRITDGAERLEPVYSFTNYQRVTERLYGSNWVLLGDAAGFVDPVFATGIFLGMEGACNLAGALRDSTSDTLDQYETGMINRYETWMDIIERFYNGQLMTLLKTGQSVQDSFIGNLINPHMEKHMGRIFTGKAADSTYSHWLLRFMCRYGLKGNDPGQYRIKTMGR
jgi:flavin-dependent dehydrogenase